MAVAAAAKKTNSKTGRTPTKAQREQAALRREAERDGLPKEEAALGPFAERFCFEFCRCGVLDEAHRATELALREPLDTSGFHVETEKTATTIKGKTVHSTILIITDSDGRPVSEADLRLASASNLYSLPEVRRRIRDIKAEYAKNVRVTAESIVADLEQVVTNATRDRQHQAAANCIAMKAKVFGVDAGNAGGGGSNEPAPTVSVEVRIRDFTGKPAPRED